MFSGDGMEARNINSDDVLLKTLHLVCELQSRNSRGISAIA